MVESWGDDGACGAVLAAGRATLELLSREQTELIDEIEAGGPGISGPVRIALEVADSAAVAGELAEAGAEQLAAPVVTPWSHRNVRLRAPDGMQLTLFTPLGEGS